MEIHVNQIQFEEKDEWSKAMNRAGHWYSMWCDERLTQPQRDEAYENWREERLAIETGVYR